MIRPAERPFARRPLAALIAALIGLALAAPAAAQATRPTTAPVAPAAADGPGPIDYAERTLANGLRVLYAPMDNAPVVHVRVLYHVGSRDERPDRQGFAHMFEHMMFKGSAHVPAEQHMKLVDDVGGDSNAFTSFDQTTYVNTVPANQLQMALWLEADRMASFKVTPEVFATERNVVAEEWRLRTANPPYGTFFQDFLATAYTDHHYQWTPIGDMAQLAAAQPAELQTFFDTYYVPNNAVLVVAGDFDVPEAERWVERYFGWIPRGPAVERVSPPEPPQTAARRRTEHKPAVPLVRTIVGFKTADYADDDHYALSLLGSILGDGASGRLYRALAAGDAPIAADVSAGDYQLQDQGLFVASASGLPGTGAAALESALLAEVARLRDGGVTADELARAKAQARVALVNARETAEDVASQLAEAAVFAGDAAMANRTWPATAAVTADDVARVAATYLAPERMTVLSYVPGPPPADDAAAEAERQEMTEEMRAAERIKQAAPSAVPVATSAAVDPIGDEATTRPAVEFPAGYPTEPPLSDDVIAAEFDKGTEVEVDGVRVIVLGDDRLPLVSWTLVMRGGGHAEPAGKEGLAGLTAGLLTRGAAGRTFEQISAELEGLGLSLAAGDGGDHTQLSGSGPSDAMPTLFARARDALLTPEFPADEFDTLRNQAQSGLAQSLSNPSAVAGRELQRALYGESALGRLATPASVASIALDDVRAWYDATYRPDGAFLVFSGDVTIDEAKSLAGTLLAGWPEGAPPKADYDLPAAPGRRVVLIDNPDGRQASIRMATPAYTLDDEVDKYPGSVAGRVLSSGIDSRMNRVLRAEKGLTYGSAGYFSPGRHAGAFNVTVDTKPETTAEAIDAAFGVLSRMSAEEITPDELADTKRQVAGSMVMQTQTVDQQAGRRVEVELNGYPLDYFDVYPRKIAAVDADGVRRVMAEYVAPERFTIVVVGPAEAIGPQLDGLGEVTVLPMPLRREPTARPAAEAAPATRPAAPPREVRPAA